jgi:hypothetical protein
MNYSNNNIFPLKHFLAKILLSKFEADANRNHVTAGLMLEGRSLVMNLIFNKI